MPNVEMSQKEAEEEVRSINEEIAKEKGISPEPPKKDEGEPAGPEAPLDENLEEPSIPPERKVIEPTNRERDDRIPLSKYQETKKALEEEKASLSAKVEQLTADLVKATTSQAMGDRLKKFSETHGISEDAARDMVQIVLDEVKPKADDTTTKKVELFIKKQEAEEKFQGELAHLFQEVPEAAEYAAEIRTQAFASGNLERSLYEIFHRFVKTDTTERKKTGETSRPSRGNQTGFDVKKVIEKINSGAAKPFEGLTSEQTDQVFSYMEKTGSRYTNR